MNKDYENELRREMELEKILHISTMKSEFFAREFSEYHRYEPTSYYALELLCEEFQFKPGDVLVDYGSGQGRVGFYLNYFANVKCINIEMKLQYFYEGLENLASYEKYYPKHKGEIVFMSYLAEQYPVTDEENIFYFFNPFEIHIFQKVLMKIMESYEKNPRKMTIILYYPSDDYVEYLEEYSAFERKKILECTKRIQYDKRECVMIYEITT